MTQPASPYSPDTYPASRVMASEFTILVTDRNLVVQGDPIFNWSTLDVTLRFNEVGSGQFTVPAYPWVRQQMVPGARIVVIRRVLEQAKILIAGPIESTMFERSDDGENSGDGNLTVTFVDDLALIAARLSYPVTTKAPATYAATDPEHWLWNGNAELGMRALVDGNAGPSALAARQVPKLVLGALAGVGSSVQVTQAKFVPLTDLLRDMARRGGGLGFRTVQSWTAQEIRFEVYQPADLTGTARFGFGLGNLRYVGYETTAPEVTTAHVGGQGDTGAARLVIERTNVLAETAWGRFETLVSRPGTDPIADLNAAGDEELAEGGETVRLASNAADTVDQRFGVHYNVGDKVSIELTQGEALSDIVQTVHLQAWPTAGEVVNTTIGSQAARQDTAYIKRLREIDKRVGVLERNVAPPA